MCGTESALADELASRMTAKGSEPAPLVLDVTIRRDADAFEATIHVEGRKQGVRALRAAGPTCDALHDALVVTLLLLLDEDPSRPAPPAPAAPATSEVRPAAPPEPVSAPPPAPAPAPGERISLWASLGGALTHGLPQGVSVAATGEARARLSRWELGLGAFWAPDRSVERAQGAVKLRVFGGRLRGCYALATWPSGRWAGCALGAVAALRGEGTGFTNAGSTTRPWFLGGLETDVELRLSSRVRLGIIGGGAATPHTESFSIGGGEVGEVYRTDKVVGWVGAELRWLIW
jgi:hypothetical protein